MNKETTLAGTQPRGRFIKSKTIIPGRRNLEEMLHMAIGRMVRPRARNRKSVIGTASVLPTERSRPSKG